GPVLLRDASDGDAAVPAVQRSVEIKVALDLLEVWQYVRPGPARGAAGLPFVVVGRCPAVGQLAIDRGTAAQDAGLLVLAQRRTILLGVIVADDLGRDLEFGPMEPRIKICRTRITVANLEWLV